jgi:hypothetical protein
MLTLTTNNIIKISRTEVINMRAYYIIRRLKIFKAFWNLS